MGNILIVLGILLGVYVGLWKMFICPIIVVCTAFDSGTLTAMLVGASVIKMIFAPFVGSLIGYIACILGISIKC